MSWLIVKAIGIGSWLRAAAGALLRWLFTDIRHLLLVGLAALALVFLYQREAARGETEDWKVAATKWESATGRWRAAHIKLWTDMMDARAAAADADRRHVARIEAQQTAIIERTKHDYESKLADTRAALRELHRRIDRAAAAADSDGGGAATPVPGRLDARCRAFGAADCDALLAALPHLLAAAEDNTAKLIALQDWAKGLLAIDWTGAAHDGEADDAQATEVTP